MSGGSSASGGGSANNSWTILTPEETAAAETLRPLAEGTEQHEESATSAAGSGESQPANGAESTDELPVESQLVSEEKPSELSADTSSEHVAPVPPACTDDPLPTSLEASGGLVSGGDALSQSEGLPEGPAQSTPDPDSFSDSYTHVTPSPDEPPASLLTTETLGGVEFTQEEARLAQEEERPPQEETLSPLNGEELQQEEEESDPFQTTSDIGKQADSPVDSEVGEERPGEEGEAGVRRRSLLAALERIGRTEEEEEEAEEDFQLPQREEDSGFSVNKCILGAVILLGLGTIFFSGVFMDLDEESDYETRELRDAEFPGKQKWLNPEVPPPPVDADSTELLNKLAEGSQQISVLQARLQAQKEELKVAKGQAAEGAKDWQQWEEVEKENSRLKTEMASLPVLQKENERMKKELESVPALQKELETLRATVTELKLSSAAGEAAEAPVKAATPPSGGQPEHSMPGTAGATERQLRKPQDEPREKKKDTSKDKKEMGGKKDGKEREKTKWKDEVKKEHKDGGKAEWKKGKFDKESKQKGPGDETKQWKEKEWKKEKASRGDEGKPWKDREGKKEGTEKNQRKEWKEKDLKWGKHEKVKEGKQRKGKEEKRDWKEGKDQGDKHRVKEEWKKGKDCHKDGGKEKWEKKDWKGKGEKEWKKEGEWGSKHGKDHSKEGKGKGERKQWEASKNHNKERKDERKQWNENERKSTNGKDDKEWKRKDERKQGERKDERGRRGWKEEKHNGDWTKDRSGSQKHNNGHKFTGNHRREEEHLWADRKPAHTHRSLSPDQPGYWTRQRDRLLRNPQPPQQQCNSPESCAQAEGLIPVPLPEFEAVLQTYLAKAEKAGTDASAREELKKLAGEFFKDGVFAHDRMSFQDFAEDLADVLEDMVEGDENGEEEEEEEDSALEEEMEGFDEEVMKKFAVPGAGEKEERSKGEWRKESGRGRG